MPNYLQPLEPWKNIFFKDFFPDHGHSVYGDFNNKIVLTYMFCYKSPFSHVMTYERMLVSFKTGELHVILRAWHNKKSSHIPRKHVKMIQCNQVSLKPAWSATETRDQQAQLLIYSNSKQPWCWSISTGMHTAQADLCQFCSNAA